MTSRVNYDDYICSAEWRALCDATIRARDGRCEACGSKHSLHVHHRSYERLGHELPDDLRVLCRTCHHLVHDLQHQQRLALTTATDDVSPGDRVHDEHLVAIDTSVTLALEHMALRSRRLDLGGDE